MRLYGLSRLFHYAAEGAQAGAGEVLEAEGTQTPAKAQESEQTGAVVDYKAEALAEVLASLGVNSLDEAKTGLASWNEYQEGQKTEFEKIQDSLTVANQSLAERDTTIADLQAQLVAAQLGVPAENTADVIILAKTLMSDKTDISAAITQVLEKYPQFKGGDALGVDKPSFVTETKQTAATTSEDAFEKALGLTTN